MTHSKKCGIWAFSGLAGCVVLLVLAWSGIPMTIMVPVAVGLLGLVILTEPKHKKGGTDAD